MSAYKTTLYFSTLFIEKTGVYKYIYICIVKFRGSGGFGKMKNGKGNKGCHRGLGVPLKPSHVLYALVRGPAMSTKNQKWPKNAEKGGSGVEGI